ncbi:MAG TPA: endonuclease/exonuclease/phosphatase family protein, partial [Deltaproteobacteria bacterium]|nr:endonuclease/exonuclease/phosphatase family protein [Deltaproteobacteria bacterium]
GQKARMQQIDYLSELVGQYPHVVLMGDMNCQADSPEMQQLRTRTGLISSGCPIPSYPSWNPTRRIDHILVSPSIAIEETRVLNHAYSDHLPVAMMISLPESFELDGANDLPGCRTAA